MVGTWRDHWVPGKVRRIEPGGKTLGQKVIVRVAVTLTWLGEKVSAIESRVEGDRVKLRAREETSTLLPPWLTTSSENPEMDRLVRSPFLNSPTVKLIN